MIEAEQTEEGVTTRNDRLIAVAASRDHQQVHELAQVNENLVREIEHFFISYNAAKDKQFTPRGCAGAARARALVAAGILRAEGAAAAEAAEC